MATRVNLDARAFAELTMSPGGDVNLFARRLGNEMNSLARVHAPSRTGDLKRHIFSSRPESTPTTVKVRVVCSSEHARYVHEGTGPYTGRMRLYGQVGRGRPAASMVGKAPTMGRAGDFSETRGKLLHHRDGQAANPFLTRARDLVVIRHGL